MSALPLLDRPVYLYSEVDRLIGLHSGTARRWINGYKRSGKTYEPILRTSPTDSDWVTWGEFVETRILSEYREQDIPTARLREAVRSLREMFEVAYPLAHLRPYLAAESGELAVDPQGLDPADQEGLMILSTRQLLLDAPSRAVIDTATLATDSVGEKYVSDLLADLRFPSIVLSPDHLGGQPTFIGRRVSVDTIAGMIAAGEPPADLAADYGLSLAQVRDAEAYSATYGAAA